MVALIVRPVDDSSELWFGLVLDLENVLPGAADELADEFGAPAVGDTGQFPMFAGEAG